MGGRVAFLAIARPGMKKAGPGGGPAWWAATEGRVVASGSSLRLDMNKASPMDWLFARTNDACPSIPNRCQVPATLKVGVRAGRRPTVPVVNDADREALQWLTVDELAARRRALVREYDRELRSAHPDPDRVSAI